MSVSKDIIASLKPEYVNVSTRCNTLTSEDTHAQFGNYVKKQRHTVKLKVCPNKWQEK